MLCWCRGIGRGLHNVTMLQHTKKTPLRSITGAMRTAFGLGLVDSCMCSSREDRCSWQAWRDAGVALAFTIPVFYEKYEEQVDAHLKKGVDELHKLYVTGQLKVKALMQKIPRGEKTKKVQ